ncbi:MAG: DUF1648 domain-containing protein [Anaerolineae bacterium]
MSFKSASTPEAWRGLLACAGVMLLAALLLRRLVSLPISGWVFALGLLVLACLPVLIYLGYRTWSTLSLEYWVDRDAVTIAWGPLREVIPLGAIQHMQRGGFANVRGRWWEWPNPFLTRGDVSGVGHIVSLATRPAPEQVVLFTEQHDRERTHTVGYALSPSAPAALIEAIQARYELGPNRLRRLGRKVPAVWQWDIWRDRIGLGMVGITLLLNLALFGYLCMRFPSLPAALPLHFDAAGQPDRLGAPASLFVLPVIGLATLILNGVWGSLLYSRQRPGAYLLWAGALLVQFLAGFALLNLIG